MAEDELKKRGYCYGPPGVPQVRADWYRCGAAAKVRKPQKIRTIGFRHRKIDASDLHALVTITDDPINASQIGKTSACYGRPAFWGRIEVFFRDDIRALQRANACWVIDENQILFEPSQSADMGSKRFKFEFRDFNTGLAPNTARPLIAADMPPGAI